MKEEVKLVDEIAEDVGYSAPEEYNDTSNNFACTSWIGWLSLGLLENSEIGRDMPIFKYRTNDWFQGGKRNNDVAVSASQFCAKDHSKSSHFQCSAALADNGLKVGVDDPKVSVSEPTRRSRILKRQPTGDEADFAVVDDSKSGPSARRRGRKTRNVRNTDESLNQEESISEGATTSESTTGTRCKPLLERKPTGDEDQWEKVVPDSPRRAGRRRNEAAIDDESEASGFKSPSRPVVRRQATGDSDTFVGFNRPRTSPRRGRKSSIKQEGPDEMVRQNDEEQKDVPLRATRRVFDRTPTGDFSEGDPVPPQKGVHDSEETTIGRSRPVIRRQPTGDASDFAPNVGMPRRGRRRADHSENDQSQQNDNSAESPPNARRSRPVVQRQATGDACDFLSPRASLTSPPSRPKRRFKRDEDQSNSQSEVEPKDNDSAGSNTGRHNIEQKQDSRSRPLVQRQPTGDLGEFAFSSTSSGSSTARRGRRRDSATSHSQDSTSGGSSSQMITRSGLVRQVTGDGSPVKPNSPESVHLKDSEIQAFATTYKSWVNVDSQQNDSKPAAMEIPVKPEDAAFESPSRGIRRTPTGDLNDFFLSDSPLKLAGNQFPKAPRRGPSPRSSPHDTANSSSKDEPLRGVKRTPTGDDAEFAMLIAMDSDGEESTGDICEHNNTKNNKEQPSRGVKRTPTGDSLDFVAYLDSEMDEIEDVSEEVDAKIGGSVDDDIACEADTKVTRGVKRYPTGDDLNFALMIDDDNEEEDNEGENPPVERTSTTETSPINGKDAAPIIRRGSVHRTPTGDEADFALLLGLENHEDDADEDDDAGEEVENDIS